MRRLLVLAMLLAGCDDDPSCAAVADHVVALAAKEPGASVEIADRAALVRNCEAESAHNAAMRRCVMRAGSLADAKGCELRAALGK